MPRAYRPESWLDPRLEVRSSPIHGRGTFARTGIRGGEVVIVWGGTVMSEADLRAGRARKGSVTAVEESIYLAGLAGEAPDADDFLNHACDPTVWMADAVTLVTRRRVAAGEELTADYALWEADEAWVARWECQCRHDDCRRTVSGRDWRRPELQARYRGHFSPLIEARIRRGAA